MAIGDSFKKYTLNPALFYPDACGFSLAVTWFSLKDTSNNPWISILNDTIRHLCVEDLRNSLLLRAIFALI